MSKPRKMVTLPCEVCEKIFTRRSDKRTPPRCRDCCYENKNKKDVSDLVGKYFIALAPTKERDSSQNVVWALQCQCGNVFKATAYRCSRSKETLSCGCMRYVEKENKVVDMPEYKSYYMMLDRCNNHKNPQYNTYGGRGISVCSRWSAPAPIGFQNFLEDMGMRVAGTTLDRIDVNGNYCKENCRWADDSVQGHNKRKKCGCSSKFIGVATTKSGKWRSYITKDDELHSLGTFPSEIAAAVYRDIASIRLYGNSARLNFDRQVYDKLLVSGGRGFKDINHDIQDVIDTLVRWQEMRKEDDEQT